jgi:hypothetical protein
MRRPLPFLAAIGLALTIAPSARAADFGYFKTPSGNIVCFHSREGVDCGIKSGLKPKPKARSCHGQGDFATDRISLGRTGRAIGGICAGDVGPFAGLTTGEARVLGYGKSVTDGGFHIATAVKGVTCEYRGTHGFFLSRTSWRAY